MSPEGEVVSPKKKMQLNAEAGIMSMDLDKLAPHIRAYYTGMQKRIMERRGFGGSSKN